MEPEPDPSRGSESTAACGSRVRVAIPPGGRPEMLTGFTNANDAADCDARSRRRSSSAMVRPQSSQADRENWTFNAAFRAEVQSLVRVPAPLNPSCDASYGRCDGKHLRMERVTENMKSRPCQRASNVPPATPPRGRGAPPHPGAVRRRANHKGPG
jgi:hypothetical protein